MGVKSQLCNWNIAIKHRRLLCLKGNTIFAVNTNDVSLLWEEQLMSTEKRITGEGLSNFPSKLTKQYKFLLHRLAKIMYNHNCLVVRTIAKNTERNPAIEFKMHLRGEKYKFCLYVFVSTIQKKKSDCGKQNTMMNFDGRGGGGGQLSLNLFSSFKIWIYFPKHRDEIICYTEQPKLYKVSSNNSLSVIWVYIV